jgi:hypothetical protein
LITVPEAGQEVVVVTEDGTGNASPVDYNGGDASTTTVVAYDGGEAATNEVAYYFLLDFGGAN